MPCKIILRAVFVIVFVFYFSSLASAQLKPSGNSGQVFVDLSVLDALSANPFSHSRIPPRGSESSISEPPAKMPRSRFVVSRPIEQTSRKTSRIKLKPLTKFRKKRSRSRKVLKKIKKPRVLKQLNPKIKTTKSRNTAKLSATPKRDEKKTARPSKMVSKQPTTEKLVVAPPPKASPKAPVKILTTPPPTPEILKSTAKTEPISPKVITLLEKNASKFEPNMLIFKQGNSELTNEAKKILDKFSTKLKVEQKSRMQLQAYAGEPNLSASRARRLSLSRALSARSYLIKNGIRSTRIDVRALGNKTSTGEPNRVDLKLIRN